MERRALKALRSLGDGVPSGLSEAALVSWSKGQRDTPKLRDAFQLALELSAAAGLDADKSMQVFPGKSEAGGRRTHEALHDLESLAGG